MAQKKMLTQEGLNKVIWKLLKKNGGSVVITEQELAEVRMEAIMVQHDSRHRAFRLSLTKPQKVETRSNLILPGRNLQN